MVRNNRVLKMKKYLIGILLVILFCGCSCERINYPIGTKLNKEQIRKIHLHSTLYKKYDNNVIEYEHYISGTGRREWIKIKDSVVIDWWIK